ncbi:MAG: transcription elongation factor GreA, partial [Spirochaetaceae bacterium]|nr:transcription elongation factor GreA [Spirochaetaceae bacterium]
KGNYVFHRTWGVGRIRSVSGDDIAIDFAKKRGHEMSLKMAVSALQTLSKDHIWALKARKSKEELHTKIKENAAWALKILIKSFDNHCSLKQIKAELVPSVLTTGEWSAWSTKAKDVLQHDPLFGVDPDNIDVYTVRERAISIEEKLYNEFKAERKFFNRVDILRKFIRYTEIDDDSEFLNEMIDYFTAFLKATNQENKAYLVASYLIIKNLAKEKRHLTSDLQLNFNSIFDSIEKLTSVYGELKYKEKDDEKDEQGLYNLQRDFLQQIKICIPEWQEAYVKLFPKALDESILHSLKDAGQEEKIVSMIRNCFENYKENRSAVVWFYNNYTESPFYKRAGIPAEKEIITLIHILDITFREIDSHKNTSENKKINKQALSILFDKNLLADYLKDAERDHSERIYTLIQDVKDLDPAEKQKLQNIIKAKFSDFKFAGETEKKAVSRILLVTAGKYTEKQKQLAHIMEVEVPANSKEIAFALSLGDLRENAEYKAAKEKQELLNSTTAKLKGEIERAQIFDPATIDTGHVSFGTTVTLYNETRGENEVYTILGPWESDPDNKIISYLSPLGEALINRRVHDKVDFTMGQNISLFEIQDISAAQI